MASGVEAPSFSLRAERVGEIAAPSSWPFAVTPEWAWGGSTGEGVRVCVIDSGVEGDHPDVGEVGRSLTVGADDEGYAELVDDTDGDVFGHGTACAGIIRSLAPECKIDSVRVLGPTNRGSGPLLLAGLDWAISERHDVINISLSTSKRELFDAMRRLTDGAYFRRTTIVASAHNLAVESYPWRFSSVVSVGSHEDSDPMRFYYNPDPPVEFYGRGLDVEVAWKGGGRLRSSGNSFATAHLAGICALIRAKHPELAPFELKSVLRLTAANATGAAE
ncbi:MAG: S8 family serine peptidase [Solirubrobacterales bacterium]